MIFVNISIIYGTTRKACTYNCVQLFLNNLKITIPIHVKEFFIKEDATNYNEDFFLCYINKEIVHLNSSSIDYLTNSLDNSDLIILASPAIKCDITMELNSLLNHLFFESIKRNTKSFMKSKIGLVISTTSGAGLSHTTNHLKKNLFFWGMHNVFIFSKTLYERNWEEVNIKTKMKINKKIFKLSNKIMEIYLNSPIKTPVSNKIISYKFEPIFKNKNVINVEFRKKHTYTDNSRIIH